MTHLSPQQLSAHLDSALHGASLQTVEQHLEACEKCRDELAALELQDQMLSEELRGESDRELFELIGLRVQSVVHPQRARALEKAIGELEKSRAERRSQAEAVARRVQEQRGLGATGEEPFLPPAPIAPPSPPRIAPGPPAVEADAHPSPAAELRRRALDEARERAEAEARAFALESERAREEAESRVLEQAAERARHEAAARRRSEEDARVRAASSARAEADRLARAAEAALQAAETSAKDAVAAQARAETRAAAAEEAQRQARRKADEARRLEVGLGGAEGAPRAAPQEEEQTLEPATLGASQVDSIAEWPQADGPRVIDARSSRARRRGGSGAARRGARMPLALSVAASILILLAALWFAIGRQMSRVPTAQLPATGAAEGTSPPGGGVQPETASTPAPTAPAVPGLNSAASEESRKPRRATPSEAGGAASAAGEAGSEPDVGSEPEEEPVDLGLLCGTVLDEQKRPVAGARVMMPDVGVVVVTDRVGRFCLTSPRGKRSLSVVALGYGIQRQYVIVGRRTSELNITLRSGAEPSPTSR